MAGDHNAAMRSRLASLDILRFLAAAAVMVYHFTYRYAQNGDPSLPALQAVTRHGYLGVEVFFIISGFVILWSTQGRSATQFVRARLLRLYPEFWVAVVISAVIFALVPGGFGDPQTPFSVLLNLTMVPEFLGARPVDGVYWTLLVEIKFYFLLWLLILFGQIPHIERWLLGCIALSALGVFVQLPGALRSILIFPYGPLFAAGGLFFLVFTGGWTTSRAVGLAAALPTAAVLAVRGMPKFIDTPHITTAAAVATCLVIVAAFAYFATLGRHGVVARLGWITTLAGSLTYPLYLLHNTGKAIFLRSGLDAPEPVLVTAAILFSFAIAYAVMRVGTGPVQAMLRRAIDAVLVRIPQLRSTRPVA